MTTELEKQFFDTFGIETIINCDKCLSKPFSSELCYQAECNKQYPTITDTHYLKLIVMASDCDNLRVFNNVDDLKNTVLNILINCYNKFLNWNCKTGEEWATEIKNKVLEIFEVNNEIKGI